MSAGTADQAVAVLVRQGLVEQRPRSGNFLVGPRDDRHVAVLIEVDVSHPNTSYSARHIAQECVRRLIDRGWRARLYPGHLPPDHAADPTLPRYRETSCPEFLEAVLNRQLRGVVAVTSDPLEQWCGPLRQQAVPMVGAPERFEYGVSHDPPGIVRAGVRRLAERGCRRIGLMQWVARVPGIPPLHERVWEAFCAAMVEAGLPIHMPWVRRDLPPSHPGAGWESFRELWTAEREKPDGLLVLDDNLMRDAATGIVQAGVRVPEDLAVVSLANRGSGIVYPFPVDELVVEVDEIAEGLADLLDRRMRGEPVETPKRWLPHTCRFAEAPASGRASPAVEPQPVPR